MDFNDIAGAGKAIEKLLDVLSRGVGAVYRPTAIKKEGEAEAYRIRLIEKAKSQSEADKIVEITKAEIEKNILVDANINDLAERAEQRVLVRELKRQNNIENIAHFSANEIKDVIVSANPVNEDWLDRFFNIAQDINDRDMQNLWGKVLAGEVAKPGSYSLRCLETLRNMTQEEAAMFQRLCTICFTNGDIYKLESEDSLEKYGIDIDVRMALSAAGVLYDTPGFLRRFNAADFGIRDKRFMNIIRLTFSIILEYNSGINIEVKQFLSPVFDFKVMSLTPVGKELMKLIHCSPNYEYLEELAAYYRYVKYKIRIVN